MQERDPITQSMHTALDQRVFPGAVLLVRQAGQVRYHRAFGYAALRPEPHPATVDTVYDLASLTKPLATTTAVLCLVQDGRVRLDDPLASLFPEMTGSAVGGATVFHLLNH
ncbi:MAG: serine hydrolase domain-containing protein, partial [Nitrospiraceae bacterium]